MTWCMPVAFAIWRLLRQLTSLAEEFLRLGGAYRDDQSYVSAMQCDHVDGVLVDLDGDGVAECVLAIESDVTEPVSI